VEQSSANVRNVVAAVDTTSKNLSGITGSSTTAEGAGSVDKQAKTLGSLARDMNALVDRFSV